MNKIDINCDLGEGGGYDEVIMPLVSSCNIACGGHFGDKATVESAVKLAKQHNVNIGAHPSYPDKGSFGRKSMSLAPKELKATLHNQIDLVEQACALAGAKLHHIKPHGALYNDMRKNQAIANLVLEVVLERQKELVFFIPPRLNFSVEPSKSISFWTEGFADRAYQNDLCLVSRNENGAVLTDPKLISERVLEMIISKQVKAITGEIIQQEFNTICVHSDTENSKEILHVLATHLSKNGIQIH